MPNSGGIYKGPGGERVHGDGRAVRHDRIVENPITDAERIDALEACVKKEKALLLHLWLTKLPNTPYAGLGFGDGLRDLRKALDGLVEAQRNSSKVGTE